MRIPRTPFRPAPLAVAVALALSPAAAQAVTYTVTTANQLGPGSLDAAIQAANANCLSDPSPVINFAVGTGPIVIAVGSFFTEAIGENCGSSLNLTIDGTTQPGSVPNTSPTSSNAVFGVTLDGSGGGSPFLMITNGTFTVRGLEFRNFAGAAAISNALYGNITVLGSSFHNNGYGIRYQGNNQGNVLTVGSGAPADRNYFYSNANTAIDIGSNAGALVVSDNFIGTDPSGVAAAPNGNGIVANNVVATLNNNVIAGNAFSGVQLSQGTATSSITNNKIGVNAVGNVVPNAIGIRTDSTTLPVNILGNTIRGNSQYGILVASGDHVQIANNSIYGNALKNISLDVYGGAVPNDPGDGDTGPNNRQNFPVVSSVVIGAGPSITVNFTFNSNPGESYTLDFYANSVAGTPAGETFLGSFSATTNAAGDMIEAGTQSFGGAFTNLSMAARRAANGDTSEFSPAVAAAGGPAVTVAPAALSFPNVSVGTTSANQTVTLSSTGTASYQISQLSTGSCYGGPICYGGAEFTCMTNCVPFTSYAPGTSCGITANFHPTMLGPQSVNVVVCDNATGSPRTIVLSGTGVAAPTLSVTPGFFDFGSVAVGSRSTPAFFRVQNPGGTAVRFTATSSGPFAIVGSNCTDPIPANGACDIDVGFAPVAAGSAMGSLVVSPSSGAPASASLQGTGVATPILALPSNLDITYALGSAASVQRITLANAGLATLDITSITISGAPFTLVDNCPRSLPPGSTCDVLVGFSQATQGIYAGTLTIVSNAPGGSRVINLRGIASPREVPILEVTPREIGYGDRAFGTTSAGELVKIRNIGGAPAVFDSLVTTADFVILEHTCRAPLAPLDTCEARVAMRPQAYGVRFGKLRVLSNAENSPNEVEIFGTSCRGSSLTIPRVGRAGGC